MVIDASALIAIMRGEPEDELFANAIVSDPIRHMSPVNWFEAALNSEKGGAADFSTLEKLAVHLNLVIVPVTEKHMWLAHKAWREFGKGRHRAKLNMGDCFAYALAKSLDEPLLFKGSDFPHTDIVAAV